MGTKRSAVRLKKALRRVSKDVSTERRREEYRPTAVVVLVDDSGVLLGRSPNTNDISPIPKGGIEEGETIIRAAFRETKEEIGLSRSALTIAGCVGTIKAFIWDETKLKNGFRSGKFHILLTARLKTSRKHIQVNKKEIDEAQWVESIEQFEYFIRHMSPLRQLRLWILLRAANVPWAVADDV